MKKVSKPFRRWIILFTGTIKFADGRKSIGHQARIQVKTTSISSADKKATDKFSEIAFPGLRKLKLKPGDEITTSKKLERVVNL
ncbi:MAG: hypothetical protein WCW14_00225 [Candidatus Paceibacterota bacterium]